MQVGVSVAIMKVVFLPCIMHMTISIVIMQVAVSVVAMYVTISTSTKTNHLISKELYQKQNGFKFMHEILVSLMKLEFHYGDDTPFIHMT